MLQSLNNYAIFSKKNTYIKYRENILIGEKIMAIGARDYIDKLLVKKYADEKVDNHELLESMVNPEKMLETMNDVAVMQRNMFALSNKLCSTCYAINARVARYKNSSKAVSQ